MSDISAAESPLQSMFSDVKRKIIPIRTAPTWIWCGAGLLVILFGVAFTGFLRDSESGQSARDPMQAEAVQTAGEPRQSDGIVDANSTANREQRLSMVNSAIANANKALDLIVALESRTTAMENRVQRVDEAGLDQQSEDLELLKTEWVNLKPQLMELIKDKKAREAVIASKLQAAKIKPRRRSKSRSRRLPFELVSIDHWNEQVQAVIRANGQLYMLGQGDGLLDWTVQTIDAKNHRVMLRHARGRKATLRWDE